MMVSKLYNVLRGMAGNFFMMGIQNMPRTFHHSSSSKTPQPRNGYAGHYFSICENLVFHPVWGKRSRHPNPWPATPLLRVLFVTIINTFNYCVNCLETSLYWFYKRWNL